MAFYFQHWKREPVSVLVFGHCYNVKQNEFKLKILI